MSETYCIVSAQYLPHKGGVEVYTHCLAREIARAGGRVVIVTSEHEHAPAREFESPNVEVVRLPSRPLMNGRYPLPRKTEEFRLLLDYVRSLRIDHVIVNTRFYPLSLIGAKLAADARIRPVIIEHGSAHLTAGGGPIDAGVAFVEHAMTRRIKRYDADFYGVSKACCTWLRHFGIEAKGVISNAIDADDFVACASSRNFKDEFGLPNDTRLVAFTGRLEPEKGVAQLVEAARSVPAHFVVAGEGSLRHRLECEAPENVHFAGALDRSDVAALLKQSDVFCLPTRSEGFSTSLLEAAACSCAPVVTDVGGVSELISDGRFGVVLENADPETIANALFALMADEEALESISSAVRERVKSAFSWEKSAQAAKAACRRAADMR